MRIVEINMVANGSTGKIMFGIAECARAQGHEVQTFSAHISTFKIKFTKPKIAGHNVFGNRISSLLHFTLGKVFARNGFYSKFATRKLIKQIKKFNPDVLQLHNLHAFCINFPVLFKYIKKYDIKTFWTLHDCWTFTGHCAYFDMVGCEKWKTGCNNCSICRDYPKVYWDNSKAMYKKKKQIFTGVKQMTLITPSEWLAGLVKQSFLKDYPVKVINNGIDLNIFKPTGSDFRQKYNCEEKFIVLGVAFGWGKRKGLDVFIELSKRLGKEYQIVLVGTNDTLDKDLPDNIISIHKTENQIELAQIYSAADVFVNPTREENYPTVNMESLACGTPVITFNTGGSPEIIDNTCGIVVDKNDVDALENKIIAVREGNLFNKEDILLRAKRFDMKDRYQEYIDLYQNLEGK